MQNKGFKKGFTLVELVVVVAVIAILAAVLIPTYTSLVKKANVSNDSQLVKNLNDRMTLHEVDGQKPKTAHDAFLLTEEFGFIIEKLTPTSSGNEIVWDMQSNRFALVDADDPTKVVYSDPTKPLSKKAVDLWKVYSSIPEKNSYKYSIYLAGTGLTGTLTANVGVDVGRNTGVTSVVYDNSKNTTAQSVVIRTNGGKLIIDAPNDLVHHFGDVENLHIKAVHLNSSFHEFGKAGFVKLEKGHFVAETGSKVLVLLVTPTSSSQVKVDTSSPNLVEAAFSTVELGSTSNVNVVVNADFADENNSELKDIIYNAEAQIINAVMVNGKYYKTLGDAFAKVPRNNGDAYDLSGVNEIKLLKDIVDGALFIKNDNSKVVIDFNGYTYTVNSSAGSTGTATQAMHFEGLNTEVTLKNGTFTTVKNANEVGIKMAMQNYVKFTAENMVIDLRNIAVEYYGVLTGQFEKFSGHEVSTFNNNKDYEMTIKDSTILFPAVSKYGIATGSSLRVINSTIEGYVALHKGGQVLVDSKSTIKGVVPYFESDGIIKQDSESVSGFLRKHLD